MLEQLEKPKKGEKIAVLNTNHGQIKIRLFPQAAPKAVENFIGLIENKYYDKTIFHRVIKDFMIQGGDPTATGRGGKSIWNKAFEDEFSINFRNIRGALSMANAGPNTNGSQFFIVQVPSCQEDIIRQMEDAGPSRGFTEDVIEAYKNNGGAWWLDGKHTVFGQVFQGLDVVDEISGLEVNYMDKPLEDVIIENAVIEEI
ncbi:MULTISPECIES: peptidylprolyl isomerase [Peptoniphilus]|uniref:Peptidyl-prolyl cis-trans isomerase n=1 Tax=Peptoniphilus lacrimalis 315-B TaxID=596330 RepID=D1VTT9_9FIRM|nr:MULTISPECIES: peptidylprolyl isomerase [Peptoniphilus]EFA90036.1 peptidyl-prolyl cis-trans isomerase, cyclophilin-type [Peptoniphilus lacrimalis 315-B]EFK38245.1 peptidyl-prolyl cis-trans isomerase, cyclophilin-type [Peptoniphilus sp. oral taxon 836 str. F0141]KGF36042.1 peptidylprolyl isomerase [Peptoniphilus lacrimalis DNF00528]